MDKLKVFYKSFRSFLTDKYLNNKKLFVSVVIILVIIPLSLFFINYNIKESVDPVTIQAHESFQRGDYDQAIQIYSNALTKDKNNSEYLGGLIEASSAKGNRTGQEQEQFQQIEPYIQDAKKISSDDPELLTSLGYAYETKGDYKEALTYYEKVTQLNPNSASAWFHLGHINEFLGDQQKANSAYEKGYSIDSDDPQLLIAKGNMLANQKNLKGAYELFIKASEVPGISNNLKAEALTAAAIVRGEQENFKYIKESLELSKKAVDSDPNYSPGLAEYGYNLYLTEDVQSKGVSEGISYLNKAILANSRIAKNYYILGLLYRADKDYSSAITNLQLAVDKLDQDNTVLSMENRNQLKGLYLYDLVRTYDLADTSVDTLSLIKQALSLNPDLKEQIKMDVVRSGYFENIQENQEFADIVKE